MESEENRLEHLLRIAAGEPAARPEFYSVLLDSEIFILGQSDRPADGDGHVDLPAGAAVHIVNWVRRDGSPIIPFFTSLDVLQSSIEEEGAYLRLATRALFEMTRGADLVLNPHSEHGKEFTAHEVEQLLAHGVSAAPEPHIVPKDTKVLLGQPKSYPHDLVEALGGLLARHPVVKRAYLALMHDPGRDRDPHLLVGLEGEGDLDRAVREAGSVSAEIAPAQGPVDFLKVTPGEAGVSEYLRNQTTPFYEREGPGAPRSVPHSKGPVFGKRGA